MNFRLKIFSFTAILFVLFSSLALPSSVHAVSITGVSPASIPAGVASQITITGTDFVSDVEVRLSGYTDPLLINSWSTTTLVVTVPDNVLAGDYSITVSSASAPPPNTDTFYSLTVLPAPPRPPRPSQPPRLSRPTPPAPLAARS